MKLICTVEMSKERGVTVTVRDENGLTTQTISMDGTTLMLKVKGPAETSTWTQTQDKISIDCLDFELNARNSIKCTAMATIDLESTVGNTTIKSGLNIMQQAQVATTVQAPTITLMADGAFTAKSSGTSILAGSTTIIKGSPIIVG